MKKVRGPGITGVPDRHRGAVLVLLGSVNARVLVKLESFVHMPELVISTS